MSAAARGMKNPYVDPTVLCAFDGSIAVGLHDMMFHDTNDVKPAGSFTWDTNEATTQAAFGPLFIGLAGEARTVDQGADSKFPVITHLTKRMTVVSNTFEVGNLLAPDSDDASQLYPQVLKKTTDETAAVARAMERAASATTDLLVEFFSRVLPHAPVLTTQTDNAVYQIPLTSMKVHDALITNLPGTAANDDMGLITGTPGTDAPTLQGVDFGATTSDEKCAFEFVLPPEYKAGQSITVRAKAGMLTTVSDGTATLDCEAWLDAGDGSVGSDICATAAQSINSLTMADKDFTITPTGVVAGDRLVIRLSFAGSDSGNAGVMIPEIQYVKVLLDIAAIT